MQLFLSNPFRKRGFCAVLLSASILGASCSHHHDDKAVPDQPATVVTVQDLPADPVTYDPNTGQPSGGMNQYTFFRFSDSTIVPHTDSATSHWDIGFRSTDIIINGGTSGPGNTSGQVVDGIFEDIAEAPASGYLQDNTSGHVFGQWYNYNSQTHIVTPVAGRIFLIHTSDGKYVKAEILSYYKGAPASPTLNDEARYYTFRYSIQQDGSTRF